MLHLDMIKKRGFNQNLSFLLLNNFQCLENAGKLFDGDIHLFFGVGGHQCKTEQGVLRCASWRNHRVDEDAFVECHLGGKESLFGVAYVQWYNRTFSLPNFESGLAEALQSIVGNLPQFFLAFRFVLEDTQSFEGSSG